MGLGYNSEAQIKCLMTAMRHQAPPFSSKAIPATFSFLIQSGDSDFNVSLLSALWMLSRGLAVQKRQYMKHRYYSNSTFPSGRQEIVTEISAGDERLISALQLPFAHFGLCPALVHGSLGCYMVVLYHTRTYKPRHRSSIPFKEVVSYVSRSEIHLPEFPYLQAELSM